MIRGEIWWAELGIPNGSGPGFRRPVLLLQSNAFNKSKISTIICCVITSNEVLKEAPGNVFLETKESRLPKNSVINVSQIITIDKTQLLEKVSKIKNDYMESVEKGILLILGM
jgi:mRNA interferase MazF